MDGKEFSYKAIAPKKDIGCRDFRWDFFDETICENVFGAETGESTAGARLATWETPEEFNKIQEAINDLREKNGDDTLNFFVGARTCEPQTLTFQSIDKIPLENWFTVDGSNWTAMVHSVNITRIQGTPVEFVAMDGLDSDLFFSQKHRDSINETGDGSIGQVVCMSLRCATSAEKFFPCRLHDAPCAFDNLWADGFSDREGAKYKYGAICMTPKATESPSSSPVPSPTISSKSPTDSPIEASTGTPTQTTQAPTFNFQTVCPQFPENKHLEIGILWDLSCGLSFDECEIQKLFLKDLIEATDTNGRTTWLLMSTKSSRPDIFFPTSASDAKDNIDTLAQKCPSPNENFLFFCFAKLLSFWRVQFDVFKFLGGK